MSFCTDSNKILKPVKSVGYSKKRFDAAFLIHRFPVDVERQVPLRQDLRSAPGARRRIRQLQPSAYPPATPTPAGLVWAAWRRRPAALNEPNAVPGSNGCLLSQEERSQVRKTERALICFFAAVSFASRGLDHRKIYGRSVALHVARRNEEELGTFPQRMVERRALNHFLLFYFLISYLCHAFAWLRLIFVRASSRKTLNVPFFPSTLSMLQPRRYWQLLNRRIYSQVLVKEKFKN